MLDRRWFRLAAAPLAVAAVPVLSVYVTNIQELDGAGLLVLRTLLIAIAAAGVLYAGLGLLLRNPYSASVFAAATVLLAFSYAAFQAANNAIFGLAIAMDSSKVSYAVVVAYLAIFIGVAYKRKWSLQTPAVVLSILASSVVGVVLIQLAWAIASLPAVPEPPPRPAPGSIVADPNQPDVYFIVLDGYGRKDMLAEICDFDNGPFLSELEKRGFFIADRSRSNYVETRFCLTSALNLDYLNALNFGKEPKEFWLTLRQRIRNNRIAELLRARGYSYVNVGSGIELTDPNASADVDYPFTFTRTANYDALLFSWTPLAEVVAIRTSFGAEHRARILHGLTTLPIAAAQPSPKFVFAHIVCPHPPFVFSAEGGIPDLDEVAIVTLDPNANRRPPYVAQLKFLNGRVLQAIDEILVQYPPDKRPIIVIQGDHGPQDPKSRYWMYGPAILNAVLAPADRKLYREMSPVNTLRLVLEGIVEEPLPLRPDRTYNVDWQDPSTQIEITK